jgi:hypothetical protein
MKYIEFTTQLVLGNCVYYVEILCQNLKGSLFFASSQEWIKKHIFHCKIYLLFKRSNGSMTKGVIKREMFTTL